MPCSHLHCRCCSHPPSAPLLLQEEAQARFWAASQSEQKHFAASFLLAGGIDKPQEKTHLHFRCEGRPPELGCVPDHGPQYPTNFFHMYMFGKEKQSIFLRRVIII